MTEVMSGVRVLEVASHVFVPIAGSVLAEWGATVLKIEHPVTGDAYRGVVTSGLLHQTHNGVIPAFQKANRGKRSVGIDLKTEAGREILYRLAKDSDVFLTNMRGPARRRIHIDVDDIRKHNPSIIYVRGTGFGPQGPESSRGGFDSAAYFARSGIASSLTPPDSDWPVRQRPAFGDVVGGLTIAGGIAAALFHRSQTGEGSVVDVSLLGVGMWQNQADIINAQFGYQTPSGRSDRASVPNPLVNVYRTKDRRFIQLNMLDADNHWANFCEAVGKPELIDDERYVNMSARHENTAELVSILDDMFASRTFEEWKKTLADITGVWAAVARAGETYDDPQAIANHYIQHTTMIDDSELSYVSAPVQFDEEVKPTSRAPEAGEHTETVLLEYGYTWDDLTLLKQKGAIL
jgi:crotonobetainyl-CoA:carnitine CoA-transferase CaiB-like acyl-CoA transferase